MDCRRVNSGQFALYFILFNPEKEVLNVKALTIWIAVKLKSLLGEKKLSGGNRMNIARNIMLMGCTRFASKRNWVERNTNGRDIANKLLSSRLAGIPVVDDKDSRRVIGIITEMNLLGIFREGMDPNDFTAETIMSGVPKTADIDTPAEELIDIMVENNFTTVPITKNNRLVGVVDRCSIMDFFMAPTMEKYVASI